MLNSQYHPLPLHLSSTEVDMQAVSSREVVADMEWTSDDGGFHRVSGYFGNVRELQDGPQGFLVEHFPPPDVGDEIATVSQPHFHRVRQFQFVVHGDRPSVGKHSVPAISFHYTDPSTPYGPIKAGRGGVGYFTLRPRADVGQYPMPGSRDLMLQDAGRNVAVNVQSKPLPENGAEIETLIEPHDDGLASFRLRLAPGERVTAPAPAGAGGQYQIVVQGSVRFGADELTERSIVWVGPEDRAAELQGGPSGAEVVVLQFPAVDPEREVVDPDAPGAR
jgi:hypothetical protein